MKDKTWAHLPPSLSKLTADDIKKMAQDFQQLLTLETGLILFFHFSQFVSIGNSVVTRPAGLFGGRCFEDALDTAVRAIASLNGDANNSKRIVLRLDFILPP